jgi:DNA invertase Pin-like site-specific DNA recombinase
MDIEQHKIDIVVVYKVDRLTRALTDFARIVERFDAHGVSFVSVTQQFNTTSSMGRLTLNVLLSFAQFEREVTGERIRDKIAASKQKGMWMGGHVPLGYEVDKRTLIINETEAETVRTIFRLYIELGAVSRVQHILKQRRLVTKSRTPKSGESRGGKPFSRGHLYRLLSNPIYRGQIRHRDHTYDGQHPAIIDEVTWAAVQATLKNNRRERLVQMNAVEPSLLAGLIEDESRAALVPHHANKRGKRYRYYVDRETLNSSKNSPSQKPKDNSHKNLSGWRIPAQQIEQLIILALCDLLKTSAKLMGLCGAVLHGRSQLDFLLARASRLGERLPQQSAAEQRTVLLQVIRKIVIDVSQVSIYLAPERIVGLIDGEVSDIEKTKSSTHHDMAPLIIPWQIRRRGVEMKLIVPGPLQTEQRNLDKALIRAIAKGHLWMEQITSGQVKTLAEIAKKNNVKGRWVSRLINLACLAPDIVERILEGTQPQHLTLQKLLVHEQIPADWQAQRELFLA